MLVKNLTTCPINCISRTGEFLLITSISLNNLGVDAVKIWQGVRVAQGHSLGKTVFARFVFDNGLSAVA